MNTPLPDNEIHTNLVSMNEIKAWNINNIKHIPKWKKQNNEGIILSISSQMILLFI